MPYEQACDAKRADSRSDIFALGATFYHLLTGKVPFGGSTHLEVAEKKKDGLFQPANSLNPQIPPGLGHIVDKMLARLPQSRYQTASELIVDLERIGLAARVPSFIERVHALQDPLVKARLAEPAQLTRIDPASGNRGKKRTSINPNIWYVQLRNSKGRFSRTRSKTWEIISALQHGKIPLDALASQDPKGELKPLSAYPPFAPVITELLAEENESRAKPSNHGSAGRYFIYAGFGLGIVVLLTGLALYLFRS
jgi:serine/threonine-protein kinase